MQRLPRRPKAADRKRAIQAWHGFVVWGTWDNRLLQHLLAKYFDAFPELHNHFGKARYRFCDQLAGIAAFGRVNPLESGWLIEFVRVVTEDERVRWVGPFVRCYRGWMMPRRKHFGTSGLIAIGDSGLEEFLFN